jgi:hypothetical protein
MRINFAYLLEKYLVPVIYVIIVIKGIFLFSAISNILAIHVFGLDELSEKLTLIKEQSEFVFIFLTSLLMIAIFNPWQDNLKYIDSHVKLLFYLFGGILIFTAKWGLFFHESIFLKKISASLQ